MKYNYKENRRVEPQKYNPMENLIDSYINNNYGVQRERHDTTTVSPGLDKETLNKNLLYFQRQLEIWNHKHGAGVTAKRKYFADMVAETQKQLRIVNMKGYDPVTGKLDVITETQDYYKQSGQEYMPENYKESLFESENESEYESEYEPEDYEYDYDQSFGGATDMKYFYGLGIWIPNNYEIDEYATNQKWNLEKGKVGRWKWRLIVLRYRFQELEYVPDQLVGFNIEEPFKRAAEEKRSWAILLHMAFYDTVPKWKLDQLHAAEKKYPNLEEDDWKIVKPGVGFDPDKPTGTKDKNEYTENIRRNWQELVDKFYKRK